MARVPYVDVDTASPELKQLYEAQMRMSGRIPNFHRILGHVPWIYRWWLGMQRSTQEGRLSPQLRSLVHVQTSLANQCAYCTTHNLQLARRSGLPDDKLAALESGELDVGLFTDAEQAVVRWVTAVATNNARRDTEAFDRLAAHFTVEEIVEITAITAVRTFSNRIQEALWTDIEDERFPESKTPGDASARAHARQGLASYVRDVLLPQLEADGR